MGNKNNAGNKIDWVSRLGGAARLPGNMFDMIGASIFINILSLALPITLLQVYDRILPNSGKSTLMLLVMGVVTALMLELVLRLARANVSSWIGARFEHLSGCAAMQRLLYSNMAAFERQGAGAQMERLAALGQLKEFYAGQAVLTVFDLPFAVLFLSIIAYLAGELVIVPVILIVLFAITAQIYGMKLRRGLKDRQIADERRFNFIIEVLGGIHTVKSMAMETQMLRRYERLQEGCADAAHRVTRDSGSSMSIGSFFSQMTLFLVVGFGAIFVINGELTIGGLAACTLLSGRAMQPLQRAVGIWARFQSVALARERVREIFSLPVDQKDGLPALADFKGEIELENVSFSYSGERAPIILNDINLKVEAGEAIGITGGNASGKTTLLYTIMGALQPTEGRVLLDGLDARDIDLRKLSTEIAYLPQEGVLFNGTILENITMFNEEKTDEAMEISTLLGLDAVVAHMPMGFDSKVGDGATDALPRGIKQRVAIARALLPRPKVVLMDEANTAMDSSGDAILRDVLARLRGHRTLIMVTHRPSMLNLCNRIYNLDHGVLTLKEEAMDRQEYMPPAPFLMEEGPA